MKVPVLLIPLGQALRSSTIRSSAVEPDKHCLPLLARGHMLPMNIAQVWSVSKQQIICVCARAGAHNSI